MRACDQSSIFSTGRKFRSDYGLLLELHALTLVARSYALLVLHTVSHPNKGHIGDRPFVPSREVVLFSDVLIVNFKKQK